MALPKTVMHRMKDLADVVESDSLALAASQLSELGVGDFVV